MSRRIFSFVFYVVLSAGCDASKTSIVSNEGDMRDTPQTGESSETSTPQPSVMKAKVPCSVNITTELNFGVSAAVYVQVQIAARNNTDHPVDGVTWSMFDSVGNVLFTETWVGVNQKQYFFINPSEIGVTPIAPGSTVALVGGDSHIEDLIRNLNESSNEELKVTLQKAREVAEEKYSNVTCEIQGFVKEMFPNDQLRSTGGEV